MVLVLHVAEKPSIATSIATALSQGDEMEHRGRSPPSFEFHGGAPFRNVGLVTHRVTSVTGHIFSTDFPAAYQNWDSTDPLDLFEAPVLSIAESKGIVKHLEREASGADYLVLWLDCDREGENICFEVLRCVERALKRGADYTMGSPTQTVFRAKFSAVTEKDIMQAMKSLVSPSLNESLAVECRQELDLKVGVAFSRFQTRYFQGRYGDLDSSVISYGPCQTPTLGFVVDRHDCIQSFKSEAYWKIDITIDPGGGSSLLLEWDKGKVFDQPAAEAILQLVSEDSSLVCVSISEKESRLSRPCPLNTVQMLKLASKNLGIGPHAAMRAAESLYLSGCLSYPRTESTAYPRSFNVREALHVHRGNAEYGAYVGDLLSDGHATPRSGTDMGDHPPITPVSPIGGGHSHDAQRVYDLVLRHFLASVSSDARFIVRRLGFKGLSSGEAFSASGKIEIDPGFLRVYRRQHTDNINDDDDDEAAGVTEGVLPASITETGSLYRVSSIRLREGKTLPPGFLTEAELISLMEKHKIGTDASIPSHINNIMTRNYCTLGRNRTLIPSTLGVVLVHGYRAIDADLVLPDVRSAIEQFCDLIAKGEADKRSVLEHSLANFIAKFKYFSANMAKMDALFEAHFSPLAQTGKLLSKCGKCLRYMRFIEAPPKRLFCASCEETYPLPQNGTVKLYKELRCPLDQFELVLFSLGNKDTAMGKSYPLCPYCYSHPPSFGEEEVQVGDKMGCNACRHPGCRHSGVYNGLLDCPGVSISDNSRCPGVLVLDANSKPNWRLACNEPNCNILLRFHSDIHNITPQRSTPCGECGSQSLAVFDFNKTKTPLPDGATTYTGCIVCSDVINSLSEVSLGRTKNMQIVRQERAKRAAGRGGRGRRPPRDPKMSFSDF